MISEVLQRGSSIQEASHLIVLLHGRGGTASGILDLAEELANPDFCILAPQAANNVWYPYGFMEEEKRNEPFLSSSVKAIKDLIEQAFTYIPKNQMFIVGFSQGACLALEVTTRFADKYGGIVAFTGGLIGKKLDASKYHGDFAGTKVFISNGDHDPYIPLERSRQSKDLMEKMGATVMLKVYDGRPHTILQDEISLAKTQVFRN